MHEKFKRLFGANFKNPLLTSYPGTTKMQEAINKNIIKGKD